MCRPFLSVLVSCALLLAGSAAATDTGADPHKAKPSSFAPHHGGKHVYGAPIQHPILHKRHKASRKGPRSNAASAQPADSGAH